MTAVVQNGVSIALVGRGFQVSETCYRHGLILSDENAQIAAWLKRLTPISVAGALVCAFCICATCRVTVGTTNASTGLTVSLG